LHPIHENRKRGIVKKCLKELSELIRQYSFSIDDLLHVIVAILYSEREQSALWEYKSANSFKNKFNTDCNNQKFNWKGFLSILNIPKIKFLIKYHKVACLLIGGRLHKEIYDKIAGYDSNPKAKLLGLMAAACYDIPSESGSGDNRKNIINIWGSNNYQDKSQAELKKTIVLYDLPICERDPSILSRTEFNSEALKNFLDFKRSSTIIPPIPTASSIDDYLYLTFNYEQSRFEMITFKGDNYRAGDYEFATLKKEEENLPQVYELRLQKDKVPSIFLHLENCNLPFDLSLIENIVTKKDSYKKTDDDIVYYPIPLSNYFPLPLLVKYFKLLHEYSKHVIEGGIEITMQEITYKFWGQLDDKIPGHFEIHVPEHNNAKSNNIEPIVKRLLAAYATNIGICVGYHRIQLEGDDTWVKEASALLKHEECGFELFIRYIECFMRSHDVNVSDENLIEAKDYQDSFDSFKIEEITNEAIFSIGIDIGGTSIKYRLCDRKYDSKETYKTSTRKDPTNKNEKYNNIKEFAERLNEGINALLKRYNKKNDNHLKIDAIDVIGISWPGAIREQKIAGASGILGYFQEDVASNYIRKNAVEKIRKIDLISDLKGVLGKDGKNITIGICNDGYAEALGRIFLKDSPYRNNKWAILKFGTGTAGSIITDGKINDGITEFGKLVINMYLKKHDEEQYQINISHKLLTEKEPKQSTPKGLVNDYCSQKLLPNIFRDIMGLPETYNITSFEIGTLAEFLLDQNNNKSIDTLIKNIGIDSFYSEKLEHIIDKKDLVECFLTGENIDYEIYEKMINALKPQKIEPISEVVKSITNICNERGLDRLFYILLKIKNASNTSINLSKEFKRRTVIDEWLENENQKFIVEIFEAIYDKAGSILADVIMLIREYYKFNGVIICGGVIQDNIPTKRMLRSTRVHLKKKYWIDFKGIDSYNKEKHIVKKESHRTIYYNFPDDFSDTPPNDQGEVGALYHAKIIKAAMGKKNKNIC